MAKIGDIFEIALDDGTKAFGQYVINDGKVGPIIQIFDLRVPEEDQIDLEMLSRTELLFPPVVVGLKHAISSGLWKIIGNKPVDDYKYPLFLSYWLDDKTTTVKMWFLWDGNEYIRLGKQLPEKYKDLELVSVWAPKDINDRIRTGKDPFENMPLKK